MLPVLRVAKVFMFKCREFSLNVQGYDDED